MMHGTWQVTGGGGHGTVVRFGIGAVAAAVLLSWLATVLWLLAVIGVILLVVIAALTFGLVRLLRRPAGEAQALADQAEALRAYMAPKAVGQQPAPVIHYHGGTHLHIEAGADPEAIRVIAGELPREKEIS